MTENKKFDLELLNKADSGFKTKEVQIPVEIEGTTQIAVLEIDVKFRPSKVVACVKEFIQQIDSVRKYNNTYVDGMMESLLIFMIIKHFSSFPLPVKLSEQIPVLRKLIDTGLLYRIFAEFDPNEISRIHEELKLVISTLEENTDEFVRLAKEQGFGTHEE